MGLGLNEHWDSCAFPARILKNLIYSITTLVLFLSIQNSAVLQSSEVVKSMCSGARMPVFRNPNPISNVIFRDMLNICETVKKELSKNKYMKGKKEGYHSTCLIKLMRIRLVNTYKALIYKALQTLSSQYKLAVIDHLLFKAISLKKGRHCIHPKVKL